MKLVAPKPFTFVGGARAVLLLHGFTGTTADVRMLGRFLQKHGYTTHAPLYRGHGVPPEKLVTYSPVDWWRDVKEGYNTLLEQGYEEIAVCGLSLGGVFSLKVGATLSVKGVIPMCAPVRPRTETAMQAGMLAYAQEYKKREKKQEVLIEKEVTALAEKISLPLKQLRELMAEVREQLYMIEAPTLVVQSREDEMIDVNSAEIIYEELGTDDKTLNWYEQGSHVITLSDAKDVLHEDILAFLNRLDWSN
ncbi:alpha/beta hydrolase [Shouchella lonarensis]|uniref:Carboxylesterase n=1 Tax=Shouchella lonarensis TaxID=1464122 RepID=A0A1G6HSQ7_9BACI|nr:carboxylesterase [Shouchella lonarensis]SDB97250.1 carboxylesterase [Shouchella lonarensis]